MRVIPTSLPRDLLLLGILSIGYWGCGQSSGGGNTGGKTNPAGGSGGMAVGGTTSNGGNTASGGTQAAGGSVGTGGATSGGGMQASGGTTAMGTGGKNTGGTAAGGTQGPDTSAGGMQGTGGATEKGGTTGMGVGGSNAGAGGAIGRDGGPDGRIGTGGSTGPGGGTGGGTTSGGAGGTSSGACQKGQVKPSEVVFMGESFYAIDPQYNEKRVEADAQAAGALAAGAKYRNVAVSGQTMNYVSTTEWPAATQGGTVKNVIMDGGGIDAMSSSCSTCPGDFTTLLGKMATAGVQDVIYTRYPEPGNPPGSNTTLKANLDILMPKMQTVCEGTTAPKCHWVDLRPVWQLMATLLTASIRLSRAETTSETLIWAEMVKDCMAQ